MSSQQQKADVESLSSLSIDPNQMGLGNSNIFGGRKSSFDYVNILKDSDQLPRRDFRNSLDILTSNINTSKPSSAPLKQIIQLYNQQNKVKIQQSGFKPMEIGEVYSQSDDQQKLPVHRVQVSPIMEPQLLENKIKLQTVYNQSKFNYHSYFPHDLAQVLKERQIPLEYVRGLLMVRDQKQIKSTRRLKVERYLQKRRKKTWNRKICYNCRQKVAQQRLRIKGKFIKKRRAMQILGLIVPIDTAQLKEKLYAVMKNKNNAQIQQLLNTAKKQKLQEDQNSKSQNDNNQMQDQNQNSNDDQNQMQQQDYTPQQSSLPKLQEPNPHKIQINSKPLPQQQSHRARLQISPQPQLSPLPSSQISIQPLLPPKTSIELLSKPEISIQPKPQQTGQKIEASQSKGKGQKKAQSGYECLDEKQHSNRNNRLDFVSDRNQIGEQLQSQRISNQIVSMKPQKIRTRRKNK